MKQNSIKLLCSALLLISLSYSCKKTEQNVTPPEENEFLTTTILNLQNISDATDKPTISYKLIGNNPVIITPDTLRLKSNTGYTCNIIVLDETKSPVDTVSKEILARGTEHLFFFRPSAGLSVTDSITDRDNNVPKLPIGLKSQIKTAQASSGNLQIILRHQPNLKDGTYAPGSTDLDVSFPVRIK